MLHRLPEPEKINRDESRKTCHHHIYRVSSRVDQPIHVLGAVMERVKTPKKRDLVRKAMPPIRTDVIDDEKQKKAEPSRKPSDKRIESERIKPLQSIADRSERKSDDRSGDDAIDEIPSKINADLFTEKFFWMERKKTLERNKNSDEQNQPNTQPEHREEKIQKMRYQSLKHGKNGGYQSKTGTRKNKGRDKKRQTRARPPVWMS